MLGKSGARYEVDLSLESDGELILIECKDRTRTPNPDLVYACFRFADIALKHPERSTTAVFVSRNAMPATSRDRIRATFSILGPDMPVRLAKVSWWPRLGEGLLFTYSAGDDVEFHVLRLHETPEGEVDLRQAVSDAPNMTARLSAALRLAAAGPNRMLEWLTVGDTLLHLGQTDDALALATPILAWAESSGDSRVGQVALNLETMARYQRAARDQRRRHPGERSVRVLSRKLDHHDKDLKSSALSFIGAWLGLHGDTDMASRLLANARKEADGVPDAEGAYLAFLADFRAAELLKGEARWERLQSANLWLPTLGPIHRYLAQELTSKLMSGGDSTIRSVFSAELVD